MSDNRTMILNMLKDGRISVEEADALLKTSESKSTASTQDPSQMFKEGFSKLEGILKNVGSAVDAVANTVAPVIEKQVGNFEKQVGNFVSTIKSGLNKQQFTEQETIVTETPVEKIVINNEWGDVSIFASARNDIDMKVEKVIWGKTEHAAQERSRELKVGWLREGNQIFFKMPDLSGLYFNKDNINVNLFVPESVSIDVQTRSGNIKINGINNIESVLSVKTTSGDMELKSVNVDRLNMETVSGDIKIREFYGISTLKSTSGLVDFEGKLKSESKIATVSGNIMGKLLVEETSEITTTSGDVEIRLQPENKGNFILSSTSGDIYFIGESFNKTSINNVSGDVKSNVRVKAENSLEITANSGDIVLKLMEDSNCSIAANTRAGMAESKLTLVDMEKGEHYFKGKFGQGSGQISLQSVSGDIVCTG